MIDQPWVGVGMFVERGGMELELTRLELPAWTADDAASCQYDWTGDEAG
jgi:hypothetical protein